MDMKAFNAQIIEEFRANQGRVEMFKDYPMVILHTIGAKSGQTHLVPLVLTINDDDEMLLFASFAGAQQHPAWVHNLRAHPEIDIELGTESFKGQVIELEETERAEKVAIQAGVSDVFAGYIEKAAPRQIPVFRIERKG
jgi:deazaflavin-dependent oxidoreductase (nitroreductase family)